MKKYYILTPANDIQYIGNFETFKDAWEFVNYDSNFRYVWIVSENSINKLHKTLTNILENNNNDSVQ